MGTGRLSQTLVRHIIKKIFIRLRIKFLLHSLFKNGRHDGTLNVIINFI